MRVASRCIRQEIPLPATIDYLRSQNIDFNGRGRCLTRRLFVVLQRIIREHDKDASTPNT